MQYVKAKTEQENARFSEIIYITDSLKIINENIAGAWNGRVFTNRFYETINKKAEPPRTAEEVIKHITDGLNRLNKME